MPAKLFLRAIDHAEKVAFGEKSKFAKTIAGVPGGREQHPAMKVAQPVALPEWVKPCQSGGGMPMITENPTGKFGNRFVLKCGDHVSIWGNSLENIMEEIEYSEAMAAKL